MCVVFIIVMHVHVRVRVCALVFWDCVEVEEPQTNALGQYMFNMWVYKCVVVFLFVCFACDMCVFWIVWAP